MRIVIVGGGIAAVYIANAIKKIDSKTEVVIVSKEEFKPYDRIHLCSLVNGSASVDDICLELDKSVRMELNQEIVSIGAKEKKIFSSNSVFSYDYLIVSTGSKPKELFDISNIQNSATFRSANDSFKIAKNIKDKSVVLMGVGPIGLELLDTLLKMKEPKKIYLISRGSHLYSKELNSDAIKLIKKIFEEDKRVVISFNDEITDKVIKDNKITKVITRNHTIDDPFLIFGVGIEPNVEFAKNSVEVKKGILVDNAMRSSDPYIYAVGEAAQLRSGFVAGRVKECTSQADVAVANILKQEVAEFKDSVTVDGLKVGSFLLADVESPEYKIDDENNENIIIASKKENRIDQYIVNNDKLVKFIGINTNIDVMRLKDIIEKNQNIDVSYFYSGRLISEKGRLVCSCASVYEQELVDIIKENAVANFGELKEFSEAGRVCGRCKKDVADLIAKTPIDPLEAQKLKEKKAKEKKEAEIKKAQKRVEKFNFLHPKNRLDENNLEEAIKSFDMNKEYNKWVSMITASMDLHPDYEEVVKEGVAQLNKIPIIWLELSDCTGNSEAFIKSTHPKVDDLILKYISLDYHELLMAASGEKSESVLDEIIKNDSKKYILIVEGAVPLGMDGKFLRIGPKGETGIELLRRVSKDAAAILAVGSCAYDGGVVAASPNPTNAVGVQDALGRKDIINLPGCPTNPVNIVGTLLHYIMFDELPKLDEKNRPLWAYGYKVHDNCERRGHYELDEFVLEWGDEGAKKGWCLFKMGCKGAYANLNCSLVKFNEGTSWPVQAGHGCFGCGEGKIAFDRYANNRMLEGEN